MKKIFFGFYFLSLLSLGVCVRAVEVSDVVELRVDNPYFSPNADGAADNLFFKPVLKSEWDVSRWRLEIFNAKNKLVQRYTGAGFSTLIQWDGRDRKGNPLPEGVYQAYLNVWGPG